MSSLLGLRMLPDLVFLSMIFLASVIVAIRLSWLRPLMAMCAGVIYATWCFSYQLDIELPTAYESRSIRIGGHIVGMPDTNQLGTRFLFQVVNIIEESAETRSGLSVLLNQKLQLNCYRCPFEILPNQTWQFSVRLKNPHGYASWGAFDFEKFLFRHKISVRGYVRINERNQFIADRGGSIDLDRWQIKQRLNTQLADFPNAKTMIAALMIGDKSSISREQNRVFQATGVSHLMAISGLHIGLVFLSITFLLKWLLIPFAKIYDWQPRQYIVLLPALAAAFAYSALAGFAVSTQRAFIMLSVFVICRLCARETSLLRVLILAAALLLLIDPYSILDVGFWLSCSAVLIIALASHYRGGLGLLGMQPLLWLGMMPMTTLFFAKVSLLSPLVNLLAVPLFCLLLIPLVLVSLILLQCDLIGLYGSLIELLARGFEVIYLGLSWLSRLPYAEYFPPTFPLFFQIGFLLVLFAYLARLPIRHWVMVIAGVVGLLCQNPAMRDNEVRLALLDVGQGLAIVVEARDYVLVYDTGPAYPSGFNAADAVLLPYLRHQGINKIDRLIISHADNDHAGGYPFLREAIAIRQISASQPDKVSRAEKCQAGQMWQVAGVRFDIIGPDENTPSGNNNQSCVLRVDNGRFSVLITGDIEKSVERYLIENSHQLAADFVLVPHHGSKTSSSEPFIDSVQPTVALVSAGYRSHFGHPHGSVIRRYQRRGIQLLSTVDSGSIVLKINPKNWHIERYRETGKGFWHRQKKPN